MTEKSYALYIVFLKGFDNIRCFRNLIEAFPLKMQIYTKCSLQHLEVNLTLWSILQTS